MEKFGRYLLLERVATGGMGEVFRAAALGASGFCKHVAIKRIHPHLATDDTAMEMFIREAKLVSELEHPNIIRMLDLGQQDGSHFLAMDFVAGPTVAQVMRRAAARQERLPLGLALYVALHTLHGLAYAHQHKDPDGHPLGIIHRDISPQNIMLSYEGAVQLVDFGIARAAAHVPQTVPGGLRGKAEYFSPEVVRGAPVTQGADTYAMGVVLWEMLALRGMRSIPRSGQGWWRDFERPVPRLESLCPELPPAVAELVQVALAEDPRDRWQSAQEFAGVVQDVAQRLGCLWTQADAAAVLASLFSAEIDLEARKRAHFRQEVRRALDPPGNSAPTGTPVDAVLAPPAAGTPMPTLSGAELVSQPTPLEHRVPRRLSVRNPLLATGVGAGLVLMVLAARAGPLADPRPPIPAPGAPKAPDAAVAPSPEDRPPTAVSSMAGITVEVEAELPAPAIPPVPREAPEARNSTGWLSLQSQPWARVYLDGKDTGAFTPVIRMKVSAGKHTVRLVNPEMAMATTLSVNVPRGEEVLRAAELR